MVAGDSEAEAPLLGVQCMCTAAGDGGQKGALCKDKSMETNCRCICVPMAVLYGTSFFNCYFIEGPFVIGVSLRLW